MLCNAIGDKYHNEADDGLDTADYGGLSVFSVKKCERIRIRF